MTQVRAIDKDAEDGPGPNGQVTYSIVSQHNKFTIDRNTGDLYTNAVRMNESGQSFDRRKWQRQRKRESVSTPLEIPFWRPFPRCVTKIPDSLSPSTLVVLFLV